MLQAMKLWQTFLLIGMLAAVMFAAPGLAKTSRLVRHVMAESSAQSSGQAEQWQALMAFSRWLKMMKPCVHGAR